MYNSVLLNDTFVSQSKNKWREKNSIYTSNYISHKAKRYILTLRHARLQFPVKL